MELTLALIAAALVVAGALHLLVGREPGGRVPRGPRHRLVVATATTADGVTAHLRVSYLVTITDAALAGQDVEEVVEAALESDLRRLTASGTVAELPTTGQTLEDVPAGPIDGARIEHVTVESADVVVSQELRRLVARGA